MNILVIFFILLPNLSYGRMAFPARQPDNSKKYYQQCVENSKTITPSNIPCMHVADFVKYELHKGSSLEMAACKGASGSDYEYRSKQLANAKMCPQSQMSMGQTEIQAFEEKRSHTNWIIGLLVLGMFLLALLILKLTEKKPEPW